MRENPKNKRFRLILTSVFPVFIALIISSFVGKIFCQVPEFSKRDLKKLEKAEELKTEAEELQLQANELYLEASVLKQDEEYDISKKLQKEAESLEKDATKNEAKAADMFEKSTSIKKDIYKSAIKEFWKDFEGDELEYTNAKLLEETANEYFYRAEGIRKDASKMNDDQEALLKKNEAYELELMALEKLISAYQTYKYGPAGIVTYPDEPAEETEPDPEPEATTGEIPSTEDGSEIAPEKQIAKSGEQIPPEPGEVDVNDQQIQMILEHLKRREVEADSAALYHPESLVSGFDMESIRQAWEQYKSMEMPAPSGPPGSEETVLEQGKEQPAPQIEVTDALAEKTDEKEDTEDQKAQTPVEIGKVEEKIVPDPNSVIIYKVQLAANRAPISQNVLRKLYYGDRDIERINENGWYKYSIGDFETFEEADKFRKSLGASDAFVVAYRGSKRIKDFEHEDETVAGITGKTETTKPVETPEPVRAEGSRSDIYFVVQIAASKSPMSSQQLQRVYDGNKEIKLREEEDWYKYQIGRTNEYEQAKETLRETNVQGAFIVPYKGNEKLTLWQVLREQRTWSSKDLIFVVQIAASVSSLNDKQIQEIYNGTKKVKEIREGTWYKYQIEAGPTYDDARRLKNLLKIPGAFAVAYKNGQKIDIRKAINMTK